MKEHIFYPMISRTLKSLLKIPPKEKLIEYLQVILDFPNHQFREIDGTDGIMSAILDELNRQYNRWNKGESDADIK